MRLKTDVLTSVNDGLMSDKEHLTSELKEVRELQRTYEAKCSELMAELTETTSKLKDQERDMIGHNEVTREREERIAKQKKQIDELKANLDELDIKFNSLELDKKKTQEMLDTAKKDLADTVNKLHATDKARHETEIKLLEEIDKGKTQGEALKAKEDDLRQKKFEFDDLDKRHQ